VLRVLGEQLMTVVSHLRYLGGIAAFHEDRLDQRRELGRACSDATYRLEWARQSRIGVRSGVPSPSAEDPAVVYRRKVLSNKIEIVRADLSARGGQAEPD
jgi:hypothetical protein